MFEKTEKLVVILSTILYLFAIFFIIYGFIKVYQGEAAIIYFLLGGCFGIVSSGKKIWDKKKEKDEKKRQQP